MASSLELSETFHFHVLSKKDFLYALMFLYFFLL